MSEYSIYIFANINTFGPYHFVGCRKIQVSYCTSSTIYIFILKFLIKRKTTKYHNVRTIPKYHNVRTISKYHNLRTIIKYHNLRTIPKYHNVRTIPKYHNVRTIPIYHNVRTKSTGFKPVNDMITNK